MSIWATLKVPDMTTTRMDADDRSLDGFGRVLWTHNYDLHGSTSGVFVRNAAEALAQAGCRPELLYLGDLRSLRGMSRAKRLVREAAGSFDIVHSQFGSATAMATTAAEGRPLVLSIRGSDWTTAASDLLRYRIHARLATTMTRRSIRRYQRVVSVSERIRGEIEADFAGCPVTVIPDPVNTERFRPMNRIEARRALGLVTESSKSYVLFTSVHSAAPHKRLNLAREAVEVARVARPNLELLVASGLPHHKMPLAVNACDVAICTSVAEGWPNSIKEALACSVPFVATDVSDLKSIAEAEPNCFVVDRPDPQLLGEALVQSLQYGRVNDLRQYVSGMTYASYASSLMYCYSQVLQGDSEGRGRRA